VAVCHATRCSTTSYIVAGRTALPERVETARDFASMQSGQSCTISSTWPALLASSSITPGVAGSRVGWLRGGYGTRSPHPCNALICGRAREMTRHKASPGYSPGVTERRLETARVSTAMGMGLLFEPRHCMCARCTRLYTVGTGRWSGECSRIGFPGDG